MRGLYMLAVGDGRADLEWPQDVAYLLQQVRVGERRHDEWYRMLRWLASGIVLDGESIVELAEEADALMVVQYYMDEAVLRELASQALVRHHVRLTPGPSDREWQRLVGIFRWSEPGRIPGHRSFLSYFGEQANSEQLAALTVRVARLLYRSLAARWMRRARPLADGGYQVDVDGWALAEWSADLVGATLCQTKG